MRAALVVALAVSLISTNALAADPPGLLNLTTQRAIVFKDGYCLMIKQGTATTDEKGEVYLDEVPDAAVLGSFWAAPTEGRLVNMVAGWKEVKEDSEKEVACTQTIELLLANKGVQAKVEMQDKAVHTGVIHEVLVQRTPTALTPVLTELIVGSRAPRRTPAGAASADVGSTMTTSIEGNLFVLRTDDGDVMLPAAQVRSLLV